MLFAHITGASLGLVGAYIFGIIFFRGCTNSRWSRMAKRASAIGLLIASLTGIFLFVEDPATFLASGKFLSNMTILACLLMSELVFVAAQTDRVRRNAQLLTMFSWAWIFAAALLNPPYPYLYFMAAYALCALGIVIVSRTLE